MCAAIFMERRIFPPRVAPLRGKSCFQSSPVRRRDCLKAGHHNNIKVHFAGSDGGEIFYAALLAAQTKYRLFSCYKYILKCRPDDDFRLPADHAIRDRYIAKHGSTKGGRWLWNNGSTITSQIWDTVIYAVISFGFGLGWVHTHEGRMQLIGIIIGQYLLKACLALLDTPFFYFFTRNADRR